MKTTCPKRQNPKQIPDGNGDLNMVLFQQGIQEKCGKHRAQYPKKHTGKKHTVLLG